MDGVVQLCTVARLRGWVYGEDATDLDVFINGEPLARIRCTKPGPELVQAGLPLDAGFELRFPRPLHRSDIVSVRFAHGAELRNSPTAPIRHEGALDVCTTSRLAGWAVLDGEPAEVEILVNGERIASIRCTEPRADLAQEGVPENSGFIFLFPRPLKTTDEVSARFADGSLVNGAPRSPVRYESSLDQCTATRVEGWAVCDGQPAELDIFVNGERRGHVHCDRPRPDLAQRGLPIYAGYACAFRRPLSPQDEITVRFPDGTQVTGSPANPSS